MDLLKINLRYPERAKILSSFKQNNLKMFVDRRVFKRVIPLNYSVVSCCFYRNTQEVIIIS